MKRFDAEAIKASDDYENDTMTHIVEPDEETE